jgi:hypothetical protein
VTLLAKAGADGPYLSWRETAAAHRMWKAARASPELIHARLSRGDGGRARFEELATAEVYCWERGGRPGAVRCPLGVLAGLLGSVELQPEGEIDGVEVGGRFVFELLHAERETEVAIWELPASDEP